jgi:hypothetical protein
MVVPVLIFAVGMVVGVMAGARWLPDLAVGPVGGLAFFAVCGLLGAAVGLVGLHIYSIVEALDHFDGLGGVGKADIVSEGLQSMLWEAGSLFGISIAVYLLAPPSEIADEVAPEGAT